MNTDAPKPPDAGAAGVEHTRTSDVGQAALAAENAAYKQAKPVFVQHCARCHSAKGSKASEKKLGHFNMDSYPFGGHHAATIGTTIREVLGLTGEKPTMPKDNPGAVKGPELEAIVRWSRAFDQAHAAGMHQHGGSGDAHEHGSH